MNEDRYRSERVHHYLRHSEVAKCRSLDLSTNVTNTNGKSTCSRSGTKCLLWLTTGVPRDRYPSHLYITGRKLLGSLRAQESEPNLIHLQNCFAVSLAILHDIAQKPSSIDTRVLLFLKLVDCLPRLIPNLTLLTFLPLFATISSQTSQTQPFWSLPLLVPVMADVQEEDKDNFLAQDFTPHGAAAVVIDSKGRRRFPVWMGYQLHGDLGERLNLVRKYWRQKPE